jgi:hypothetical protein
LLLILLVVYVAVVSAPISMRVAGSILPRNGLREVPLSPGIDDGPSVQGRRKAASVQPLNGSDAAATQLFGAKMYMSREENHHEQAMAFSIEENAGHLLAWQSRLCRERSFPHARFE